MFMTLFGLISILIMNAVGGGLNCESKFSFESNHESNQGVVVYVFNDEQRCAVSPGWFLKQYCTIAPTVTSASDGNREHKINLNYNGTTVEVFLLNSERGLRYDGRCG